MEEIKVRVHQKTPDGYRRIRFDDTGTAVKQLKVTAAENEAVDIALEQSLSAGRSAPEVLVLTGEGIIEQLAVEGGSAKLNNAVQIAITGPETLEGGALYKTDVIDFGAFKSVEGIEVKD